MVADEHRELVDANLELADPELADPELADPELGDEYLDLVDAADTVVGRASRRRIHREHLLHRGVHVLVVNRRGELLTQLRAAGLDTHPGLLDASAGGHVLSGESYPAAAVRELYEELGCHRLDPAELTQLTTYDGYSTRQLEKRGLFVHRCDGPFRPDPATVAAVEFHSPERLVAVFDRQPSTEGFRRSVSLYFDHLAARGLPTPGWRWQPGPEPRPAPRPAP